MKRQEEELIALLRRQDPLGMDGLVRHYGPLLRYVIYPILPDGQERVECLSDVMLLVWQKVHSYDPGRGSWTGWLSALARNTALNRLRGKGGMASVEELPQDLPSTEEGPEEALLRRERAERLRRALDGLTPGERNLFYRKYYYMQPTAQIASELGLTERAVEGRLYRVKKRLRKKLGGEDDG